MLERLARCMQKKTIDNDEPTKKANDRTAGKREELRRIHRENKLILRRILDASPEYDHKKWEEEAKKREVYLANIAEFPPEKQVETIKTQAWVAAVGSSKDRPTSAVRPASTSGPRLAGLPPPLSATRTGSPASRTGSPSPVGRRPLSSSGARPRSAMGTRPVTKRRPASAAPTSHRNSEMPGGMKRLSTGAGSGRLRV
jgi:hypothetical protein